MNVADTMRALWRRWYIVIPGLLLAVAVAIGAWTLVKPTYERVATQLLLPGIESIPENSNPFLYLGGLSNAADVLVDAVASSASLNPILAQYPGAEVEVTRDGTTAGPVLRIVANAKSDADAAGVIAAVVENTAVTLEDMQKQENIAAGNRITVLPITVDAESTPQQRNRLIATAGAGAATVILTLLLAALVDGMSTQRRRRSAEPEPEPEPVDEEAHIVGSDEELVIEKRHHDRDELPWQDDPIAAETHAGGDISTIKSLLGDPEQVADAGRASRRTR